MSTKKEQVITLLQEGLSPKEITDTLGVTKQYVSLLRKEANTPFVPMKNTNVFQETRASYRQHSGFEGDMLNRAIHKLNVKKAQAKRSGIEFDITFEDINWISHCPVLGIELGYFNSISLDNSVSFDRIDPSKGYVKGNVEILSMRANRLKSDGTVEEFQALVNYYK